jgi:YD repeat-containing protein
MSYLYDAVGNRTKRTDHNGTVTNYTYDNLNRLTVGSLGTYTYDDLSRMLTATNYVGTVSFTYDNRGRIDTTTDVFGKVLDYDYDENGNRTLLKLDGVGHTGYSYDTANRLATITNVPESTTTIYTYNLADKLIAKALPNGVTTTLSYDGMSRLTRLKDEGTSVIADRQYTYNAANEIASITEPTRTRSFTYDTVDRLTAVTDSVYGSESYSYDAVGNRTSSHRSSFYSYSPFNRLTSTNSATYTYDNNGTITSRTDGNGTMNFSHDSEGRLYNAYKFDGAMGFEFAEYQYDALGRRVSKSEPYDLPRQYTYILTMATTSS